MTDKYKRQAGQVLVMVLMALAGGSAIMGPLLGYISTALTSLRMGTEATGTYYAADAGTEHAIWRLKYGGLTVPTDEPVTYVYSSVNKLPVTLYIVNKSPPVDAACDANQWPGTQVSRVTVGRTVSPLTTPPGVPTTFNVSIKFKNVGTSTIHYQEIGYTMPVGFSFVSGSASGVTTANPTQNNGALAWTFSNPLPGIHSGDSLVESFRMIGTLSDGVYCDYCDVAWVIFGPDSIGCVLFRSGDRFNIQATASTTSVDAAILISDTVRVLSWETR